VFIGHGVELVVIEDKTSFHETLREQLEGLSYKLDEELISSLISENQQEDQLTNSFSLPVKYVLINEQNLNEILRKDGPYWDAFYKRYPKSPGVISISKAGFNQRADQAIIYLSRSCGSLCGTGSIYILQKDGEDWVLQDRINLWVS
jgi:hypothetical protein